ncbi:outer membrane beta-barrel protein [Flavihumibacter sp. UBA7668]|uniref:outer membrane beta-barrel protein n=1 Tax=Flavihumibacter sp. UBA7668 TaxID=1946542 RepID=UPI0025C6E036|nr:outer membrane beta-barrel protein [Flavihumibacter sp. UBA7668]
MKQFFFLLISLMSGLYSNAQLPAGVSANRGAMQAPPNIGRIYGKIVDSSGKGIGDASVVLLHQRFDTATKKIKEVLLKGASSQSNGDFNFEELPIMGQYTLNISVKGYTASSQKLSLAQPFEKDLGKIQLEKDVQQLEAVVVTASTNRLKMDIDKKVFSVGANIVSAGGTAVDVMKNVPSVNVDIDGNVTVRNASPQIYVDGRPTTLTLDQIPADAIESVEVITNPSAKYDASGGNAGILNIVLKKNKKSGYNGTVNAGVDKRGGINGGASLNLRQNKINFNLSVFGNQNRNRGIGETTIQSFLTNPNLLVDQSSSSRNSGGFLFGRSGLDYFATNRSTFSVGFTRVRGKMNPSDLLKTDSAWQNASTISYSERNTENDRVFNAYGFTAGYKYLFPGKGEELTADLNFFSGKSNSEALYTTSIFDQRGGDKTGSIEQRILGNGKNQFVTIQTDYVRPFTGSAKLEAGLRAQLRTMENQQGNYFYNASTGQFEQIINASSNYANYDNVYAGYLSFKNSYKDFSYQVGLRGESSDYKGELTDTKQEFRNTYPISLFPSLFLSQKLKNQQELQMSITRRINRPFFMQVIPFIDSTDQLNWSRGNAGLKPEFTYSAEMSYSKSLPGNNTILASIYYKHTTDLITRYIDTITTGTGEKRPLSTYTNADRSRSYGAEITGQFNLAKWWDMNTNFNLYNSKINASSIAGANQDALWSYFAKMNNNFKLPHNFKIQLSGTYQSKTNQPVNQGGGFGSGGPGMGGAQSTAQGYIKSNYGIDAALQKSFLKNNAASITLSVSDIFRTRRFEQYTESAYFIQNSYRLNDVPMFRLNFSLRFGQVDMSLFKRKNMKGEMEGSQGAMQGM